MGSAPLTKLFFLFSFDNDKAKQNQRPPSFNLFLFYYFVAVLLLRRIRGRIEWARRNVSADTGPAHAFLEVGAMLLSILQK